MVLLAHICATAKSTERLPAANCRSVVVRIHIAFAAGDIGYYVAETERKKTAQVPFRVGV
jgi:hypothetical protein